MTRATNLKENRLVPLLVVEKDPSELTDRVWIYLLQSVGKMSLGVAVSSILMLVIDLLRMKLHKISSKVCHVSFLVTCCQWMTAIIIKDSVSNNMNNYCAK